MEDLTSQLTELVADLWRAWRCGGAIVLLLLAGLLWWWFTRTK
jgi:hypothetical protein